MAKHVADQVANLVKRLSHHLNRRVSDILMFLFNNKSAGSVGALAGFAIALIFAWKFLNPPGRPPRNPQKRRNAPSTSGSSNIINNVASGSEVCSPSLNIKDSDLIEGTHPPVELTLGQVVRRKLNGSRKMTCQLLGVILEETSPGELQKHAIVRLSAVEVLLEITKHCDLYLMETVHDGESEERVLTALENAGLFKTGGLIKEKVLFCSTENGRSSFVRQLEPDWHIDTNPEIISQLARFIRYQLHISPASSSFSASNVFTSTSLEKYFC